LNLTWELREVCGAKRSKSPRRARNAGKNLKFFPSTGVLIPVLRSFLKKKF